MQQTIQQLQMHGKNHQTEASVKMVSSLHQLSLHSGQTQKRHLQNQMVLMQVPVLESIALRSVLQKGILSVKHLLQKRPGDVKQTKGIPSYVKQLLQEVKLLKQRLKSVVQISIQKVLPVQQIPNKQLVITQISTLQMELSQITK